MRAGGEISKNLLLVKISGHNAHNIGLSTPMLRETTPVPAHDYNSQSYSHLPLLPPKTLTSSPGVDKRNIKQWVVQIKGGKHINNWVFKKYILSYTLR